MKHEDSRPFQVIVADNYHYMDTSEYYTHGWFATLDEAINACIEIVEQSLRECCNQPGMSAADMLDTYKTFGDDPFIVAKGNRQQLFSAWTYAEQRAPTLFEELQAEKAMGDNAEGNHGEDAPTAAAPRPAMTVANDATIISMIGAAKQRLIYLAPGLSRSVAAALVKCWHRLGAQGVQVIVDVDPEVCRLGYGEMGALRAIESAAQQVGGMVHNQPGVRIGLVIADEQTLIFAPTPLLIEASPAEACADKKLKPNAVRIGQPPADVARDLGLGAEGIKDRTIGLDKAERLNIELAAKDLKANPPQRFDIARTVRIFNAYFEFVELSIKGLSIDRKRIKIPSDLLGLDTCEDELLAHALRMTLGLVDRDRCDSVRRLQRVRNWISRQYLTHLPNYGHIIAVEKKAEFLAAVEQLRRIVERMRRRIVRDLRSEVDRKKEALIKILLPLVAQNRPKRGWWKKKPDPQRDPEYIRRDLDRAFGSLYDLIAPVEVRLVFKAVTYDSLTDPAFIDMVRRRHWGIAQLHEEHMAATSTDPLPIRESVLEGTR